MSGVRPDHSSNAAGSIWPRLDWLVDTSRLLITEAAYRSPEQTREDYLAGASRFSSSAQFSTTVSPAVSAWVPVLGA